MAWVPSTRRRKNKAVHISAANTAEGTAKSTAIAANSNDPTEIIGPTLP